MLDQCDFHGFLGFCGRLGNGNRLACLPGLVFHAPDGVLHRAVCGGFVFRFPDFLHGLFGFAAGFPGLVRLGQSGLLGIIERGFGPFGFPDFLLFVDRRHFGIADFRHLRLQAQQPRAGFSFELAACERFDPVGQDVDGYVHIGVRDRLHVSGTICGETDM